MGKNIFRIVKLKALHGFTVFTIMLYNHVCSIYPEKSASFGAILCCFTYWKYSKYAIF